MGGTKTASSPSAPLARPDHVSFIFLSLTFDDVKTEKLPDRTRDLEGRVGVREGKQNLPSSDKGGGHSCQSLAAASVSHGRAVGAEEEAARVAGGNMEEVMLGE